jgi:hypothetical protein
MPSWPPTLPSLRPPSDASYLPQLVVVLSLVLRRLSFSSHHRLPSGGTSTCPLLVTLLPLVAPLFFSCALASCLPRLFVVSPLATLPPPVCLHLRLSLHHHLSLCPSHVSCLAGCCIAFHHTDFSLPLAPPTLVAPSPLVAPLLCLSSTLAGCCVASTHDGASRLPVPLPLRNSLQAVGLILIMIPNSVYDARLATIRRTL